MKPNFYFIALMLVFITSCGPARYLPLNDLTNETTMVHVECRNDQSLYQRVLQVLRLARVSDWTIRDDGPVKDIKARYRSLQPRQAVDIEDQLKQMSGVLSVVVTKDYLPAKNF